MGLIVALVAVAMAGQCAGAEPIVDLKVHQLPDLTSQTPANKAQIAVMRRFMERYPNVRLSSGTGITIEGGSNYMDAGPLMQIAGDISPDIIYVNFRFSGTYIEKGYLKPLDSYMKGMSQAEIDRRVPPAIRDVCYRMGPDGKKHWYTLPTERVVLALTYRRDLFARAGLDPDRPPRTWDEFHDYSRKLCNPDRDQYGMVWGKGNASSWQFANLVRSAGGDIVAKDGKGDWGPTFNTKPVEDALYFYVKMNTIPWTDNKGRKQHGVSGRDTSPGVTRPGDPYAMAFASLYERLNVLKPGLISYAAVPHMSGASSSSEVNCLMLGIFAGVDDPDVAQAAYDYIAFQDSDEANGIRTKAFVQGGLGKFVNPILLEQFGYEDQLKYVDKEWVSVYKDAMVNGKPEPYGRNATVIYRELSRPVEQAINDKELVSAVARGDEEAARKRIREILNTAQAATLQRVYGIVPPEVAKLRHRLTILFLAVAIVAFSFVTIYLVRLFKRSAPSQTPGQKRNLLVFLLLIPAMFSVFAWQYLPLARGSIMACQDYNVMGDSPLVGVANFAEILFDAGFWHSVWITLIYVVMYMIFAFVSPILLALLLTEVPRGKIFFRTVFYLPAVLSGLVVVFLWKSFYTPAGLLNTVLGYLGIHLNVSWLDQPSLAMVAVLLPTIWAGLGPGCLIYLAALKMVPEECYEAADIDGAGVVLKVRNITLPFIKMLIMINAIGAIIGAFMTSETIFAMTAGGPYTPHGATEVVGLQLFYTAFVYLKFGVANAMAWVLGFILLGLTLIQIRNLSRVEFKGGR